MAELLYRLGKFSARRAWTVIVAWLAVLGIVVVGFLVGFKGLSSSFDIPGTAAGAVVDELSAKLPDYAGASGTVVFRTDDGSALTADQRKAISTLVADADHLPDVSGVNDPFATEAERAQHQTQLTDGQTQLTAGQAQLDAAKTQLTSGQAQLDAAKAQLAAAPQGSMPAAQAAAAQAQLAAQQKTIDDGLAQLAAQQAKLTASQKQLDQGAELLKLSKGIRLVSADGSTALVNVAFTKPRLELSEDSKQAVIHHFQSTHVDGVTVSFSTDIAQGVPQVVGVGEAVGVVFAAVVLLIVLGSVIAAALPLVTALFGVAVAALGSLAFSGVVDMASVTPVLAIMLGLAVGIDYSLFIINRHRKQLLEGAEPRESVGLANGTSGNAVVFAGITVVVALLALNVTGVPFLGLMGTVGAIAVVLAVLIAVTLTPAILGLLGLRVLSRRARASVGHVHHDDSNAKPMKTWRAVLTTVGAAVALLIVAIPAMSMRVGLPDGSSEPVGSTTYEAFTVTEKAFGAGATGPLLVTATAPSGVAKDDVTTVQLDVARTLADQKDVVAVAPIAVSGDRTLFAFQVVPKEGPNSVSTENLVTSLRGLDKVDGKLTLGVSGQTAINQDISANLAGVLPLYLVVVVGLSLLIMILVFRSILVPLIATGGFILSLFATYGAITALFQWGWGAEQLGIHTGPILSFLPVILVGILFGLAMDYQLFLASGMREAYVHGAPARLAVAKGFRAGRTVVIAAGLIMISVFGGFIFSESTMIRSIGFGLAFGVLVDAFVVRMLLMPALMHLLGRSAWWLPKWLDRLLPNVDVEGAALERRHHAPAPAPQPEPDLTPTH
ncbi:MMPL family transporter [Leifsonia shinshuensis]|uniref:MMPL family transporter n=1 Tax=Leifsonia shinshuensis TaxID=150026 RepID=A0A7G6YCZ8_9MICO|nr:MMPL family transporter [Leifsonia shinshuensis]QNE36363.1 MMPL family transporter [Leifsonia shinshuensis]